MFAFFYSLYVALFTGTWHLYTPTEGITALNDAWNSITAYIYGLFSQTQTADLAQDLYNGELWESFSAWPWSIWAVILALITLTTICAGVFALVKAVFRIFFTRA